MNDLLDDPDDAPLRGVRRHSGRTIIFEAGNVTLIATAALLLVRLL